MNPEERLAAVVTALESIGLSCLVMGGHAVRFYGLGRYTNDFDLALAPDGWDDLADGSPERPSFRGAGRSKGTAGGLGPFDAFSSATCRAVQKSGSSSGVATTCLPRSRNSSRGGRSGPMATGTFPFSRCRTSSGAGRPSEPRTGMIFRTWRSSSTPGCTHAVLPAPSASPMPWRK